MHILPIDIANLALVCGRVLTKPGRPSISARDMRRPLIPVLLIASCAVPAFAHEEGAKHPEPKDDATSRTAEVTGSGDHLYRTVPNWGNIPEKVKIGPTHGAVVVDKAGLIYTSSDSASGIFVFNPEGALVKTIAPEFSGIHGMCIREEQGEEFLYAAHLRDGQALKLRLDGSLVLKVPCPAEANLYPGGKGYKPTGIAVAPAGEIFVSDGYGSSRIHKFDAQGKYLTTFGTKGKGDGQTETSHGLAIDNRSGTPRLLVCDRENRRLVHFDLDGNFIGVVTTGLRRPCALSIQGDLIAVAELEGRVAILDKQNKLVAALGDNPDRGQWAKFDVAPQWWKAGIFTAPHGVSFDATGNLYVQDWNKTGRLTKLVHVAP